MDRYAFRIFFAAAQTASTSAESISELREEP